MNKEEKKIEKDKIIEETLLILKEILNNLDIGEILKYKLQFKTALTIAKELEGIDEDGIMD